jgi:regulator of RNase E activity RraA
MLIHGYRLYEQGNLYSNAPQADPNFQIMYYAAIIARWRCSRKMSSAYIGKEPKPLPPEILERAMKLSTPLLSDAMNGGGAMDAAIKPAGPGMKAAGAAMTVDLRPGDNLFLHKAISMGKEGFILVGDGKGYLTQAYMGELMAEAAQKSGLAAVVIDGAVRDREAIVELKMPVYARGYVPSGPHKDGPGRINVPISCAGVAVHPGDLVMGDDDGVVVVPRDRILEVLEQAEKKAAYEEKRKLEIRSGQIAPSWLESKMKAFGL